MCNDKETAIRVLISAAAEEVKRKTAMKLSDNFLKAQILF